MKYNTIPIKEEIKQEIKSEPLDKAEEVHDGSNDDLIYSQITLCISNQFITWIV